MKSHLNLLPISYRRRQLTLLCLRRWAVVWAVALAVAGLLGWNQWSTYRVGAARLNSLRREFEPVEQTIQKVARIRQTIQELQQRESLALKLADEKSMFTLLGLLSRAAYACEGRVSIQDLVLQRSEQGQQGQKLLTLSGLAVDNQAVAQFVQELRALQAFRRVELKNTGTTTWNQIESRTYSMECVF